MALLDFKKRKINLVERREWEAYDTAGELNDLIFYNAGESYSLLDAPAMDGRIDDVLSTGARRRVMASNDEVIAIVEAMKSGELEAFEYLIRDWLSWAWERAFIPTDENVKDALKKAAESIGNNWKSYLGDYEALWEIAETLSMGPSDFVEELITEAVRYERKPGWYDRYLVMNPADTNIVDDLLKRPIQARSGGILEWTPPLEIEKKDIKEELESFYAGIEETVVERTLIELASAMRSVDVGNRVDFNEMWKEMLEDSGRIKEARKELRAFLKDLKAGNA